MPRRLPVRPAKIIGNVFVCIVLSFIATMYYYFVFKFWGPRIKGNESVMLLFQSYRVDDSLDSSSSFSFTCLHADVELFLNYAD